MWVYFWVDRMQMRVCVQCIQFPPLIVSALLFLLLLYNNNTNPWGPFGGTQRRPWGAQATPKTAVFLLGYRSRAVWLLPTLTSLTAAANPPKCNEGFFLPLHWHWQGYWMKRVELNDIISPPPEDKKPIINIYTWIGEGNKEELDGRIAIRPPNKNVWAILVCGMFTLPSIVWRKTRQTENLRRTIWLFGECGTCRNSSSSSCIGRK